MTNTVAGLDDDNDEIIIILQEPVVGPGTDHLDDLGTCGPEGELHPRTFSQIYDDNDDEGPFRLRAHPFGMISLLTCVPC